jgi:hypothetical protein
VFFSCNCAAAFAENKKRNKNKKLTLENADIPFNKESDGRVLNGFLYISNLGAKVLSVKCVCGCVTVCVCGEIFIFMNENLPRFGCFYLAQLKQALFPQS